MYRENIDESAILDTLDPLFEKYAAERVSAERFGDFVVRSGIVTQSIVDPNIVSSRALPLELIA